MERGFKSRCEEMSRSLRAELGLGPRAPLLAADAGGLFGGGGVVRGGPGAESVKMLAQLLVKDPDSWSAVTVSAAGREAIIVNPTHRWGRYSSDVMHELSHLLLGHEPSTMFFAGEEGLALRGYNKDAEEEANWLAGASSFATRRTCVFLCRGSYPLDLACEEFGVSRKMLAFRMRVTGAERQHSRRWKGAVVR